MESCYILSSDRKLTNEEQKLVWNKPRTHIVSEAELRISSEVKRNWEREEMKITNILLEGDAGSGKTQLAKALSSNFGLPYTKVTCFSDMDKSDILGSILPALNSSNEDKIEYKYYPSEIVRAYENGWLLEIQEPTVIRDAAVLMALNSVLELDGSINLADRILHRHKDFMVVITTNRGYNGCRPLNEALRDRVQHVEKMDIPNIKVMIQRAKQKTGCRNHELLFVFAKTIILLDKTAKANAIKGVAGMRSYFYWVDAVLNGVEIIDSLYNKVIYKISTDPDEISILENAIYENNLMQELESIVLEKVDNSEEASEIHTEGKNDFNFKAIRKNNESILSLKKSQDSEDSNMTTSSESKATTQKTNKSNDDGIIYHELSQEDKSKINEDKQNFRKKLNKQAREKVKGSIHEKINLIVHRPEASLNHHMEYNKISSRLMPIISELVRRTKPLLEHEISSEYSKNRIYGTKFNAEATATPDFRYFSHKCPPENEPSLAVALRIDQSGSMNAFGRLEAAKEAAVAVYEFCSRCNIPLLIYGDTADRSPIEKMSLFSYIDCQEPRLNSKYSLMAIQSYSNNRDGMVLKILAERLKDLPQKTKLLISISDGQPKAMPDYAGDIAISDMKKVISEYTRKDILFLAAAIGHDKETICDIYGQERFMDISNLKQLPTRLVNIIANYI